MYGITGSCRVVYGDVQPAGVSNVLEISRFAP